MKSFKSIILSLTCFSLVAFALSLSLLYFTKNSLALSAAITFGTTSYHFTMRLMVGYGINALFHNKVNSEWFIFKERSFEQKLYRILWVRRWKKHIPSYAPPSFDMTDKSVNELIGATCQAELVHLIIVIFSFAPMVFTYVFGEYYVFLITSLLSAAFDGIFIILQRYNRPRLKRLQSRTGA